MHGIFIALLDGQMLRRDGRSFACLSHAPVSATIGALFLGKILSLTDRKCDLDSDRFIPGKPITCNYLQRAGRSAGVLV